MRNPLGSRSQAAARFLARHSAVIVALALFAAVGIAVFDDYGITSDEGLQRKIGYASLDYILGNEDAPLDEDEHDRFYGVAFEIPLILVERALGLEDSRDIFLSRHLTTHLFFLAGGFFAWMLTYRLFGSRLAALLAMLLFLLHPRIYAHSFFNTKDLPFLSMFMIALYLTHRAFRRDSAWAFALCGAGVGLLANIRVMGLILLPAVLGMLALDAFFAAKRFYAAKIGESGREAERAGGNSSRRDRRRSRLRRRRAARAPEIAASAIRRALANAAAFVAAFAISLYAAWPLLWREPLGIAEGLATLSQHPNHVATLFRGEWVRWPNIPWDFIPTWILITTPPVALILAAIGIACIARLCAVRWRDIFENSTARFGLLTAACVILPIAAAILLNSNVYNDWRHMYYLYAPLCVLAAFGLSGLAALPKPRLRTAACALAALGIAVVAVQMVRLHPMQKEYFGPLVNRNELDTRWQTRYWNDVLHKEALETMLELQPDGIIFANKTHVKPILPEKDRLRLIPNPNFPSFSIIDGDAGEDAVWKREANGLVIVSLIDSRDDAEAAFSASLDMAASAPVASGGGFDIYRDGGKLTYVKENCAESDTLGRFALSVFPANRADLDDKTRDRNTLNFDFERYGARRDGECIIIRNLPDYPISHIETGQWIPGENALWRVSIPLEGHAERYANALASISGAPAASGGGFDIYREGDTLTYVKEGCGEEDARGRFSLAVFPADPNDLPQDARDAGAEYETMNFDLWSYGAIFDGKCVIVRRLPSYPISHVQTGQWIPGSSNLWGARIRFDGFHERYSRALSDLSGDDLAIRSDFAVYLKDRALTYVKSPCAEHDARGRFALSIFPIDPADLDDAARDRNILNFDFHDYGAIFDGKCVIIRDLPAYPINHVETGQWIPGANSVLWRVRIIIGE